MQRRAASPHSQDFFRTQNQKNTRENRENENMKILENDDTQGSEQKKISFRVRPSGRRTRCASKKGCKEGLGGCALGGGQTEG